MYLLLDELVTLSRTPYFSNSLQDYLNNLINAVELVIDKYDALPAEATREISETIWLATKYLHGGTSKTVPYETVYALKIALDDWVSNPCSISTALRDDLDYHFLGVDPGQVIQKFIPGVNFNSKLIQIALPKLYRHYPLYNVALYHELGHFVDNECGITNYSFLLQPPASQHTRLMEEHHRKEYFADLFAACYTGRAISLFLDAACRNNQISFTHPATSDRISVITDFLKGTSNKLIDFYQNVLDARGLPKLKKRYVSPDITDTFDAIRTFPIASIEELHGILDAGWNFLVDTYDHNREPWSNVEKKDILRIINDLIEKSIRNRMVVLKWKDASNHR
ncbi:MAG: hypothetical protein AB2761_18940 [Candidatus Thiodiazotropha endolucinida]